MCSILLMSGKVWVFVWRHLSLRRTFRCATSPRQREARPRRFLHIEFGGRGMPPPLRTNSIAPTAPHPAPSGPPSPRGRRIPDRSAAFCKVQPYTPSEPRKRGPPPPTRREAYAFLFLRIEFVRIGARRRPYSASPEVFPFISPPRRPLWSFFSTLTARSSTMPRR